MPPLVSVLITVHNREKYLKDAIDSVFAQTFTDYELIIVDDCSTDRSFEIARNYQSNSKITLFRNERNLGQFQNRTRAAELASGKLLKYLDSDDIIYPHSLAIMVEAMEANPDAAVALSHSLREDDYPYPWKLSPVEAWRKQFLGRGCLSAGPSAAIMRRDAFFEIGGFGNWGVLNDIDLWYRMAARWPVVLLPPGLVWWRRHEQQEFTKDNGALVYLENSFALTLKTLSSPECPLTEAERCRAIARAKQHHSRHLLSFAVRGGHPLTAARLFRKARLGLVDALRGFKPYG